MSNGKRLPALRVLGEPSELYRRLLLFTTKGDAALAWQAVCVIALPLKCTVAAATGAVGPRPES